MRLLVKYLDGSEVEVVRTASALRAFEEKNDTALSTAMASGRSWWADEIAHLVLAKQGEELPFEEWLDTVETILWERPASDVEKIAAVFGWKVTGAAQDGSVDPTGGAEAAASRAGSSTRRRSSTKTSKD